jgi:FKBP-type peptidyl-prolyl cis-trans isomerase FklB
LPAACNTILEAGDEKLPTDADTVEVHYQGTLINGTEFDSSIKRGKPLALPIKQIIAGWSEALKLMPGWIKWRLLFRPNLPTEPKQMEILDQTRS